jgi:transmembrane sensor
MSETSDRSHALDEASRWFTELKRPAISAEALREFREWRRDAANAAAFAKVERIWETAATLGARPGIQKATEAALAARPPRADPAARTWPTSLAAGFASLAILAGGGAIIAHGQLYPTYSTEVGGQRLAVLKDGSRVRLNTDSKIQVRFRDGERRIRLIRGEGFFDVAHDSARPFIVETAGAEVRALGTKFDVRRDAGAVRVTLVEGRVQVRQAGQRAAATLAPNQTLTVSAAGISPPQAANAVEVAGWTTGRLTFRGVPLRIAVQEINRYSEKKIVLTDSGAVADEPVSGQFEPGDTATFLAAVEAVFDLQASDAGREIRLAPRATTG